ncbi:MAG: response regulator transcription factor [Bacteroidota bacterium]
MKINVLLADDHNIVIEGLKAVLEGHDQINVVAEAFNGQEVISKAEKEGNIQVVVLDINMPVMDGISCARKLKKDFPNIKIIILTMYAQRSFVEEILKIGIDGCLLKNNTGKELKDAIIRVMEGKSYYDLIQGFSGSENEVAQYKLAEREIEIIRLLAQGMTSQEIAERLFISHHTVKTHRKNILRKTELHNTGQLIQFALNNKII